MALSRGELARKLVHVAMGGLAFAVRPLGAGGAALCALAALVHNAWILPRYGRLLWRREESARGFSTGIVLYPAAVLALLLLFWKRPEVAAAAWGILAFGDGLAALAGQAFGRHPLAWNPAKSWEGSLAYLFAGGGAAALLLLWTAPGRYEPGFAVGIAFAAAAAGALLESLPQGLDDNLGVPLVAGLFLIGLATTAGGWGAVASPAFLTGALVALGGNLLLAALAWRLGGVDRSGALVGTLLGTVIWAFAGWRAFALLVAFYALGTAATRLGYAEKARRRLAEAKGGRRGVANALSKVSVPAALALLAGTGPHRELLLLALAGSFATSAADTCSSEIGQLHGRRAWLVTTLRRVPPGTDGAISLEGTAAGLAAALAVGGLGWALGLLAPAGIAVVTLAALLATTLESVAGATLERRGLLDNHGINFLDSLAGALIALALGLAFGGTP